MSLVERTRRSRSWLAGASLLVATACGQNTDAGRPVPVFYDPPSPLPGAAPGTVVKAGGVPGAPSGIRAQRIMYHSRTNRGEDIATTALLVLPGGDPPPGGFPLVAAAHGTTGIVQTCAPSIDPFTPASGSAMSFYEFFYEPWIEAGYAVVGADYQGLGAPGPYAFLVGQIEGQNVLDSVRAARAIEGDLLGAELILFGHSQGGNSAGWAAQIQPEYAPELDPSGVILAAPAASLLELLSLAYRGGPGATTPFEAVVFLYLASLSYQSAYDGLDVSSVVLPPYGPEGLPIFQNVCAETGGTAFALNQLLGAVLGEDLPFRPDQFFRSPADFPEPWVDAILENGLGNEPIEPPILMVQGCSDTTIPISTNFTYFDERLCPAGEVAQFEAYPGQTHSGVVTAAFPAMIAWADARLAGDPAPTNCAMPPTCS